MPRRNAAERGISPKALIFCFVSLAMSSGQETLENGDF